jgi:hypothetical protein
LLNKLVQYANNRILLSDVAGKGLDLKPLGFGFPGYVFQPCFLQIDNSDPGTFPRKQYCRCRPNASCATGNQRCFLLKPHNFNLLTKIST